jgi:hypothetical protein
MPTFTLEREHVLSKIVGQLYDREWRTGRHHTLYIKTAVF